MPFKEPGLFNNNPAAQRLPDPRKMPDFLERLRIRDGKPSTRNTSTNTNNETEKTVLKKIIRKVVFPLMGAALVTGAVIALMLSTPLLEGTYEKNER